MASDISERMRLGLRRAVKGIRKFAYNRPQSDREPELPAAPAPRRLGLALGGGFARGLAHIGVLKVLTENHFAFDALAGVSVGSVIAAAFASGMTVEEMAARTRKVRWKSFARWTVHRLGLATNERMEELLRDTLRADCFEDLPIPLAVVATDLATGEPVTFRQGELIPPVRASCCFPGLFVPVKYQGRLLVDGAVSAPMPVEALQELGVDTIIGVYLKSNGPLVTPTNIFQVIGQAFQFAQNRTESTCRDACQLVIEPDTTDYRWDDFARAEELIAVGERAARQALPALRALLEPGVAPQPQLVAAR